MSNRVVHFEIPSDDPEKSVEFFKKVFGWKFRHFGEQEYYLATTGEDTSPGINGAVMRKIGEGQPVINTISVEDLEKTMKDIESSGGKIVKPKSIIPGVGWLAFFADPDGNMHGIMQEDRGAK